MKKPYQKLHRAPRTGGNSNWKLAIVAPSEATPNKETPIEQIAIVAPSQGTPNKETQFQKLAMVASWQDTPQERNSQLKGMTVPPRNSNQNFAIAASSQATAKKELQKLLWLIVMEQNYLMKMHKKDLTCLCLRQKLKSFAVHQIFLGFKI